MKSIALTPIEHQAFTNVWRGLIGDGVNGTGFPPRESGMQATQTIYADYPDILGALGF